MCPLHTKLVKLLHTSLFLHLPLYSSIFTLMLVSAVTLCLFTLRFSPLLQPLFWFFSQCMYAAQILVWNHDSAISSKAPIKTRARAHAHRHNLSRYCLIAQEPNSSISTGTCIGNCPCGKTSKPPIVMLLLPWPRDTAVLSPDRIYQAVQIFRLLHCLASLEQQRAENVSVLRKGESNKVV